MSSALFRVATLCSTLAFAGALHAEERCELSFDSGRFDVCTGRGATLATPLSTLAGRTEAGAWSYWVVKFATVPSRSERARLAAIGADVLDYLPHHAYRIRLPAGQTPQGRIAGVLWTGAMAPQWKVDAMLTGWLSDATSRPPALPISVSLNAGADADAMLAELAAIDGVAHAFAVTSAPDRRIVLSVEGPRLEAVVLAIAPRADVAAVSLRKQMNYFNARAGWLHQSGTQNQRPVFDHGLLGCGQVIGVLDSGVDYAHCAFRDPALGTPPVSSCASGQGCAPGTPDFGQRKLPLYYKWSASGDAAGDGTCSATGVGHGTHVAGSITGNNFANTVDCAAGTFAGTPTNLDGTAPGAKLIAQEMGENLDYLNSLNGTIYHAAETAYLNGARIHSNSWGGSCCLFGFLCQSGCSQPYDEFARDADRVSWDHKDLIVAIAAGNDGQCCANTNKQIGTPGLAKSPLTIGASGAGTAGENVAGFSSRGPTIDGRIKPDIMAQGDGIVSSASAGTPPSASCGTCTMSGTSMATPTAAGLIALIREYLGRGFYPGGQANAADAIATPSAALVKAMAINGARDMTGTSAAVATPNITEGWGRMHLDDVLYFSGDTRRLWLADAPAGLVTGDTDTYALTVTTGEPLKITLVWGDYPAAVNANPHIVNRLRLEVETPTGEIWTQKLPASGTPNPTQSTTTTGYDDRNVVHQITFAAPVAGSYTVRVRGIDVAMGGSQPYALVAAGALQAPAGGGANLALRKTAPPSVPAGGTIVWNLMTFNAGPAAASAVTVIDSLPAGVVPASATGIGWSCQIVGQTVSCALGTPLTAGTEANPIAITAVAPATATTIVNAASVTAAELDPNPSDNVASVEVAVLAPVDLSVTKTASVATVQAGAAFDYRIVAGGAIASATAVVVADALPAGLCVTAIAAADWDCRIDAGVLECEPLQRAPGPITLSVLAPDTAGPIANTATIASAQPDSTPANNSSTVTVTVAGAPADRLFADDFEVNPTCL
ncbi:S8 family serine peptidase [Dokdonella koreensis]|uniref:Peptidase S8 and S53 subtilisin kexin sedolisin n=1 Tax=Dokdonella koreensis DS-123 TaxID=1300342 RepID=A0A160DV12_9GAMM|nr:S8 family serine peptidase [Dokdonella koreensis]ANB18357.1 Peptidase S8 and S53 subtilisin kexin sedolisin [Dokdonella koreensis DS-123]